MSRGIVLAGVAAAVIVVGGALALRDLVRPPAPEPGAATAPPAPAASGAGAGAAASPAGPPPASPDATRASPPGVARPSSLRGTRVDGGLVTDAGGRFVPTPDARRLFDYFLAASGEEPEAVIVARIRAEIARRLPPEAARDANLLLDRYLAYRARARELAEGGLGDAPLEERLVALRELRLETLGEEAALALFAEEEAVDQVAVERQRLAEDAGLTAEERERRLAELEETLPPEERAARRAATQAIDLRRAEQELLEGGGSAEELRALRERAVGSEAADRLAALDAERARWRGRIEEYRAARAAIESDPTLDPAERGAAIARLRAERFDPTEQLRVEALDRIELR